MLARGYEVHVAAPGLLHDAVTQVWLAEQGVFCHEIPLSRAGLSPLGDLRLILELIRLMRWIGPDVFIGYTVKPVVWGLIGAQLALVPQRVALITGLGYAFTEGPDGFRFIVGMLVRGLYQAALRCSTLIFFQNPDDRFDFQCLNLIPQGVPVRLVSGSGVDLDRFPMQPLPSGPICFLLIARLLTDKGIREYVEAARLVRQNWSKTEFHLVGGTDPNPTSISEAEVRAWHAAGDVNWHGQLEDVRPILAQTSVYVLPSYREGTPRTVLEAMATGRPIITTDAPGCRETVIDGVNGFLVPPRDAEALAAAMLRFIEQSRAETLRMAQASLCLARARFDVHKVNAQMLSAMGL